MQPYVSGLILPAHHDPRKGDRITPECIFTGYDVKASAFSGKMVMEYQRALFRNQRNELVAQTDLWIVRAERSSARKTGKYARIEMPHPWTPEELEKVDQDVLAVKGPLGLTDIVAYCVGAAPVQIAAHGVQLRLYKKHPAWAFRDPENQSWEPVYGVHYLKPAALAAGVPYPYDIDGANSIL